ncbi:carbohydrate binding domain-containing protein [Cohnella faecalis]|uniref:Alpha amylase n=1 Tax=Cohnella faecalis TaxID=2315694 RepID=A0A398CN53_9BACL|nr:carbohydrate binding domain-containing protein [Cohnella faecalis]RIE00344.1 alpha amylase [Cohnella faecalis]
MVIRTVRKSFSPLLVLALFLSVFINVLLVPPKPVHAASIGTVDENDTIYQIMVDRFNDGDSSNNATGTAIRYAENSEEDFRYMKGGDWQGVIDKLGYIKNMGYTAIWISPVAEPQMTNRDNNGSGKNTAYHGYNVKDPNKANPYFGTKEKLKELVDSAHALGIKVVIDVVPNHIGDYMLGTQAFYDIPSLQPAAPFNNPAWYHHNGDINWSLADGNYDPSIQAYLENHDLGGLDDIDFDVPAAKQAIFDSIKGWFDYTGADGARVDAAKLMWPTDIGALQNYLGVNTFGENFDGNAEFVSRWVGTNKEWGMLDFPLFFQVLNSFAYGQSFDANVKNAFAQDFRYNGNENHMVTFIDNHDRNRFLTEAGGSVEKLQNALAFIFTVRGVPVVFQGTEQNKGNGNGQIITGGISDTWNRWSMVKRDTNGSVIQNYFDENTNTYQFVAKLNQIRKTYEALRKGKQREMWSAQNLYAFSRRVESGTNVGQEVISVFSNASSGTQTVTIPLRAESTLTVGTVLVNQLNTSDSVTVQSGGATGKQITVSVGSNSGKIYAKQLTDTIAPTVPTNVTATAVSSTSIQVGWTASTDNNAVTGYEVYRNGTLVGTPAGTSFTDTGLTAQTTYSYTVKAYDAASNKSALSSPPATATTLQVDTQPPSVPQGVTATAVSSSAINVAWTASTDNISVTGYEVFRNGTLIGQTASLTYADTGLAASTAYSYTVKAFDAAGNRSDLSAPPAVATTSAGNNVTIYYKQGFTTPYIHYRPAGGTWTTTPGVPIPAAEVTGYNKITINIGTATQLEACFNNGSGTWDSNNQQNYLFGVGTWTYTPTGNIVSGGPDSQAPTVPLNVGAIELSATSISVTWNASTDNVAVTGYEIYRNGTLVGTSTSTSYTDTGLAASTLYSYTVKAYDAVGNKSALSSPPATATTAAGNTTTIYYKNTNFTNSYIHYKIDGSSTWTTVPGTQLQASNFPGYNAITINLGSASGLTAAFNNGSGSWDNNGGNNYTFASGTWSLVNGNKTQGQPQADSVTFRVTVPSSTPANGPVYISGSFNSWNAADPAFQLTKGSDGVYSITLSLSGTAIQYKFTRGSWATVEANSNGSDISNRSLTPSGGAQTVNATVQRWKDQ